MWRFTPIVQDQLKRFIVEAVPDGDGGEGGELVQRAPNERIATFSSLRPNTTYRVKVVAEYNDNKRVESEERSFTTSGTSSHS